MPKKENTGAQNVARKAVKLAHVEVILSEKSGAPLVAHRQCSAADCDPQGF